MRPSLLLAVLVLSSLALCVLATPSSPSPSPSGLLSPPQLGAASLGVSDDGNGPDFPSAGKAAIACIVVFSFILMFGLCFWSCTSRYAPKLATRQIIGSDGVPINYALGWRRWFPVAMAFTSFIFKIVGMGVDSWTIVKNEDYDQTERWGVLGTHVTRGSMSQYMSYKEQCDQSKDAPSIYKLCNTIRAGGALTLVCGILTLLFSAMLILLALVATRSAGALANKGVGMWRMAGLGYITALGAYTYWVCGAYIDILWLVNQAPISFTIYLSISWWFMLIGLVLDSWVGIFIRRAVYTSFPEGVNGYAPMGVVVQGHPAPYQPPQPYTVAAYPQQQAYPVMQQQGPVYANGQPVYGQPQGYGAPTAYGGQPQQFAYQPPNPQQPPAFNPYSNQPQH